MSQKKAPFYPPVPATPVSKSAGAVSRIAPKPNTSSTRQELDQSLKQISALVEKDPRKVAEIFKTWLDGSSRNKAKKSA